MAHILITSGPTRQYLDPVRFLSNESSGRMGAALAAAALGHGHQVTIVSGPVQVSYPDGCTVIPVTTTAEMLSACRDVLPSTQGVIGAAAPCDYMPIHVASSKLVKTNQPLQLELIETSDIIATLAEERTAGQWVVGFALETDDPRFRALMKLEQKNCDMIILNEPSAMNTRHTTVEVIQRDGTTLGIFQGPKLDVAVSIMQEIQQQLIQPPLASAKPEEPSQLPPQGA